MSTPKADPALAGEEEQDDAASDADDVVGALRMANDVDGLLALAKQHRAGTGGVARDMKRCFEAYVAAAELGSPVAQHAVGLFFLNGGVVERDEREAASQFRAAADQGHLPAKVLVANLYELGVHYRADAAKADVWYRNVARSAGVEHGPGTADYARALADLGAVRYCLEIANDASTSADERTRLLRTAKTYGYRAPVDPTKTPEPGRPSMTPEVVAMAALSAMDAGGNARLASDRSPVDRSPVDRSPVDRSLVDRSAGVRTSPPAVSVATAPTESSMAARPDALAAPQKKPSPRIVPKANVGLGATAFLFSIVFAAVGLVLGHVLRNFGLEKLADGETLPLVGKEVEAIVPAFALVLAVLPNLLVYRLNAFLRASLLGAAAAIAGEVLWGMRQQFLETRPMQITDFGVAGLLLGLLVFGIFGGARAGSK